jgi:membrane associated rhomboid family serine protease
MRIRFRRTTDPRPLLWTLIAVNVAVFLAWQSAATASDSEASLTFLMKHFLVSYEGIQAHRWWTLVTSAFSHIDAGHLVFNMLALWVFGRDVAALLGPWRSLHLYLAGALLASLGHVVFQMLTGSDQPALGASGSVMTFSVVFAALYPTRRLMINFLIPVPAAVAVAGYLVLDLVGAIGGAGSGIAHAAHLGGALYGLVYWFTRLRGRTPVRG